MVEQLRCGGLYAKCMICTIRVSLPATLGDGYCAPLDSMAMAEEAGLQRQVPWAALLSFETETLEGALLGGPAPCGWECAG